MKRLLGLLALVLCATAAHAAPLRVFIRGGSANRGHEIHAHPRFLAEWKPLLAARGLTVDGATDWPTPEQAAAAVVILVYAQDGGDATPEQQRVVDDFVKRGGGLVVIHTGAVSMKNPGWWRGVLGGAWKPGTTKWREGPMDLYFTENQLLTGGHPITRGASNFHLDDEIYYDMDLLPEASVLAASDTPKVPTGATAPEGGKPAIHDIQPQLWAYEKDGYRAFVTLPGHQFKTFALPQYRAILLRGIAWAGKRENLDEYCQPEEIRALTYPEGGPRPPAPTADRVQLAQASGTPVLPPSGGAPEDAGFVSKFNDPVPQPPATRPVSGPRVLLVGGGSSHDFVKFFGATDKALLAPVTGWVDFTQNANGVAPILANVDVLVWSANQPLSAATRKALLDYVDVGKALIGFHPGLWYSWKNFPEWNRDVVGGGARGHDKLGEFEVTITDPAHPITADVPATFPITDELYWFQNDPAGVAIEVLATATSTQKPGTYPQVFVVKHPKAKIVGITLGHDARAHDLPAFQTLLKNAVNWAAK